MNKEIPIFDPLISYTHSQWSAIDFKQNSKMILEDNNLEFENEIFNYECDLNENYDLEWDDYDQDNFIFNLDNETLKIKKDKKR